jgi:PTH2 family peptidyl-tRNA hydrolase
MTNTDEYRIMLVFRKDLDLSPGKMAAQAGHASLSTVAAAGGFGAERVQKYMSEGQTKISVQAPDEAALRAILDKAQMRKLPCALIQDAGHTEVPTGTVTVLGLGPVTRAEAASLTGYFPLVR